MSGFKCISSVLFEGGIKLQFKGQVHPKSEISEDVIYTSTILVVRLYFKFSSYSEYSILRKDQNIYIF